MFDHIGLEVSNLEKSKTFYSKILSELGFRLVADLKEYNFAGYGTDRPQFWIGEGSPKFEPDQVHVCFAAGNRTTVKAFYEAAIKAGARDNGKPGIRKEYHPNYYAAFVLDYDGYNIEACCHHSEADES